MISAKTQAVFNKRSVIYNITYVTGAGNDARTYRWQLGQFLHRLNSCIYDIVEVVQDDNTSVWEIMSYNFETKEIVSYRTTSSFDEITANQEYLLSYE